MDVSPVLCSLAKGLFEQRFVDSISGVARGNIDCRRLLKLDRRLGGLGVYNIDDPDCRYDVRDRDIFRPFQYCCVYFFGNNLEWLAREIVHMTGLHLEAIVKRMCRLVFPNKPLGYLLRHKHVTKKLDADTLDMLHCFTEVYNQSKHHLLFDSDGRDHLFTPTDSVTAYFITRQLGLKLLKHVRIHTKVTECEADSPE